MASLTLRFSDGSTQSVSGISQDESSTHTFADVSTTSVMVTVTAVWGTANNGAEEITFSYVCKPPPSAQAVSPADGSKPLDHEAAQQAAHQATSKANKA